MTCAGKMFAGTCDRYCGLKPRSCAHFAVYIFVYRRAYRAEVQGAVHAALLWNMFGAWRWQHAWLLGCSMPKSPLNGDDFVWRFAGNEQQHSFILVVCEQPGM